MIPAIAGSGIAILAFGTFAIGLGVGLAIGAAHVRREVLRSLDSMRRAE